MPERFPGIFAPEAIRTEHMHVGRHQATDLLCQRLHVVACNNHRDIATQLLLHITLPRRLFRIKQIPALDVLTFSSKLGKTGDAENFDGEILVRLKNLRSRRHLSKYGSGTKQAHLL